SRENRRVQPGANGSARRAHRRRQLAVARRGAKQRRAHRIMKTQKSRGELAVNRRIFAGAVVLAGFGVALSGMTAQAQEFGSPELIAAAKAEGKLVFYTANFAEVEQQVIKAFNKRFPD